MRQDTIRRTSIAIVAILIGAAVAPAASAGHEYTQYVWFNWDTTDLDVAVVGVHDPALGSIIESAMDAWRVGLDDLDPEGLGSDLTLRTHWIDDGTPPADLEPNIVFVPQGAFAQHMESVIVEDACVANAPLPWHGKEVYGTRGYRVAAHEFGHCLGLDHVYRHGVEYEPGFDLMGAGDDHACPSTLNLQVLERVYDGDGGRVTISSGDYEQADCPEPDTVV